MGNYNYQYQKYYNNLLNGNRVINKNGKESKSKKKTVGERIFKRALQELVGVTILISITILCKSMYAQNNNARIILNYSKDIVKYNFDYRQFSTEIGKLNSFELSKATKN